MKMHYPKLYNGKRDNYDHRRPEIGIKCYAVSKGKSDIKNIYVLENILTNKGLYDTYILRNVKTGKMKKSIAIMAHLEKEI